MKTIIRFILVKLGVIPRPDMVASIQPGHPTPDSLRPGRLIVVRDAEVDKWACMRCPGGCGEKIMLSTSAKKSPMWRVLIDWLGRPTVEPSVLQVSACRCHFWVKEGRIEWCPDSGPPANIPAVGQSQGERNHR